ncbi:glycoside hydrolase, partial [Vibrio cholerae]|nr:glycoside hydrolase [Vibrio cholerae]
MQSPRSTHAFLRHGAAALATAALIGCSAVAPSFAAPTGDEAAVSTIPSPDEIKRAQDDTAATTGLVSEIEGIIATAGEQLQESQLDAFKAQNDYNNALAVLDERRATATLAEARAVEAADERDAAEEQVGRLAGDLYRSGGMNPGIESVLDGTDPDEVMYRASTLYGLSSTSTRTLEDAESASEAWASLTEDAAAARQAAQDAADTAEEAGSVAREAAADAERLVSEKEAERSTLVGQLATLRNTTAELEDRRLAGLEQAQRERDLARLIAQSAAAASAQQVPTEERSTPTSTPPLRDPASLQVPAQSVPEAAPALLPPATPAPAPAAPSAPGSTPVPPARPDPAPPATAPPVTAPPA